MMQNRIAHKTKAGFSLVELAVVIAIIAVVVAVGVNVGNDAIKYANYYSTQQQLKQIQAALDDYMIRNETLPCPADLALRPGVDAAFGQPTCAENLPGLDVLGGGPVTSHVIKGMVPVRALNLPDNYAADAWGNKIKYVVTLVLTTDTASYQSNGGAINMRAGTSTATSFPLTDGVRPAYALVSHGGTGQLAFKYRGDAAVLVGSGGGSFGSLDYANAASNNKTLYDAFFNDETTLPDGSVNPSFFDDVVVWAMKRETGG